MTPIIEPDDDAPVGRVLSRREVLGLLAGLGGVTLLAACDPSQPGAAQPTSAAATSGAATQTAPAQAAATASGTPLNAVVFLGGAR
ncbi:MAG TPA: hypothetical protein VFH60_04115 [Chloroflexia bacterium]|nr:hypothetical protein [Chloroflexia bacterium]